MHSTLRTAWLAAAALTLTLPLAAQDKAHWVGTWATSPFAAKGADGHYSADETTEGVTLREIAHLSLGGSSVRVSLSNEFGSDPLIVSAATVALSGAAGSLNGAAVPLTFGGKPSITVPPGAMAISDPAALKVAPLSDLAVSLYLPDQPMSGISRHGFADQTNYAVAGNAVTTASLSAPKKFSSWDFLKGIDVAADADAAAIVVFGDSITDGARSTRDKNARWPDILAARLAANKKTAKLGVLNQGIGGNRVLHDNTGPSALARFDRDVLAQPGVKYVVFMEGINDIGHAFDPKKPYDVITADDIIQGYRQMIDRAHVRGIKVFGATLTPYVGAGYQSPEGEKARQAVNTWIRTSKELDGVVDFDKVTTDPANPGVFLPAADGGDHLHPGDAGYKMMGDSIDLNLFTK